VANNAGFNTPDIAKALPNNDRPRTTEVARGLLNDAYANKRYGTVGRPRTNPAITEIAKRTIATKNTIFAASIATPEIAPNPSNAATNATIKNVTAQPNMTVLRFRCGIEAACEGNVGSTQKFQSAFKSRR
jgi:hypothetical protein